MDILGYVGILGLFVGMVAICFFWGFWEWKKPKDPGPLYIDLGRTIKKKLKKPESTMSRALACDSSLETSQLKIQDESNELSASFDRNETIRVRGNLRITKGEIIPFNIIVDGNLTSQEEVTFKGGLHVKGRAVLGARNRFEKSIVCEKELILFEDAIVYNCIDCEGLVFIKSGARVGVGPEGGGIASASTIFLENAEGPLEIRSAKRIRIVGALNEVIRDELKEIVEVSPT